MSVPKVLLLGGHGKVALHLTPLLLARSWNVTSVVRNKDHEADILKLGKGKKGKLDVLVASLDDVKTETDARAILEATRPTYVVWSAGAGGKGGPQRTYAIDRDAAKAFISESLAWPSIKKFVLVSYLGSRRKQPPWMSDEDWAAIQNVATNVLPDYHKAKLEADEFFTARTQVRNQADGDWSFQGILLRPGTLTDDPATHRVQLGRTRGQGSVTREDVAIVADRLLARKDTRGWIDLLNGDEDVDDAIERVVEEHVDAVQGEDLKAIFDKYKR